MTGKIIHLLSHYVFMDFILSCNAWLQIFTLIFSLTCVWLLGTAVYYNFTVYDWCSVLMQWCEMSEVVYPCALVLWFRIWSRPNRECGLSSFLLYIVYTFASLILDLLWCLLSYNEVCCSFKLELMQTIKLSLLFTTKVLQGFFVR